LEKWRPEECEQRRLLVTVSSYGELEVHAGQVALGDDVGWVLYVKNGTNLLLSRSGSRSCQADDTSCVPELFFDHVVQDEVGRPEVVRPLAGAMDLVDAYHGNVAAELAKVLHEETFWSDEEHFDFLLLYCGNDVFSSAELLLGVQGRAWDEVRQLLELVGHE